jgi:outer membrane protein TolC
VDRRRLREKKTDLAPAVAAPAGADLDPDGALPTLAPSVVAEEELVRRALAERQDLAALADEHRAAEADVDLAGAMGVPARSGSSSSTSSGAIWSRRALLTSMRSQTPSPRAALADASARTWSDP